MQRPIHMNWRNLILLTILGAGLVVAQAAAQAQLGQPTNPKEQKKTQKDKKAAKNQKEQPTIFFQMHNEPWKGVIEFVAEKTKLHIATPHFPTGSFSFQPAKGPDNELQKFTIGEVIDIINESLQQKNFTLLRRHNSLYVWPASDKIPADIIPLIPLEELAERGKSEIVSVFLRVENVSPEEIALEVKKLLGPFGEVTPLSLSRQLWMSGRAGYLQQAIKVINDIDGQTAAQLKTITYQCKFIFAKTAEEHLLKLMPDASEKVEVKTGKDQTITLVKKFTVVANEFSNTLIVSGSPSKVSHAEDLLKQIDVPTAGDKIVPGPFLLKQYNLSTQDAETRAAALQEIYKKKSESIIIRALSPSAVMVYASPMQHMEIAVQLQPPLDNNIKAKLIPILTLDATELSTKLKAMYPDPKFAPVIEVEATQNAIFVKGTAEQVAEVESIIKIWTGGATSVDGVQTRVFTLGKGSGAVLAEVLAKMLPQIRKNPVQLVLPGDAFNKIQFGEDKKDLPVPPKNDPPKTPNSGNGINGGSPPNLLPKAPKKLNFFQETQFIDPKAGPSKADLPGDENAPIIIKGFGNKLIVESRDAKALQEVHQLVNLMIKTEATEGDYEVIPLKNADAVEVARLLDEVYNPKPKTSGKGGPGGGSSGRGSSGFGSFNPISLLQQMAGGGGDSGGSTDPTAERIRVVADPATNSLIVKANLIDMMTIKKMLATAIDTADSDFLMRTWIIGPLQYAEASEVAMIISDVYKQNMGTNPQPGNVEGFRGLTFFSQGQSSSKSTDVAKKITLSLGVDERNNALVVSATKALYEDVKELVKQIDTLSADTQANVTVIPLIGVDPELVKTAINLMQNNNNNNKKTTTTSRPTSGFGSGGFGSFSRPPGMSSPFGGGSSPFGSGRSSGGSSRSSSSGKKSSRGPDFFVPSVMDDRQVTAFFDPQAEDDSEESTAGTSQEAGPPAGNKANQPSQPKNKSVPPVRLVNFQEKLQPPEEQPKNGDEQILGGPKGVVEADVIPGMPALILRTTKKEDLEEVLRLIEFLKKLGETAEIEIELVPLEQADPTDVTNLLNQLLSRVNFLPGATTAIIGPGQPLAAQPAPAQPIPGLPGLPGQQPPGQFGPFPQQPPTAIPIGPSPAGSIFLMPIHRQHAILVAAPRARIDDVIKEIKRFDIKNHPLAKAVPFQLKNRSAAEIAGLVQAFYAQRYPLQPANTIRLTSDVNTNTVLVQASPADLDEIRELIWRMDNTISKADSELRIVHLKNALAAELAILLTQAITTGAVAPAIGAPGIFPQPIGPGIPGGPLPVAPGLQPGVPGAIPGVPGAAGPATKNSTLKFFSVEQGRIVQTGILQDIRINAVPRINSLIIAAPPVSMDLILALIRDLDVPPPALSEINIFTLKNVDAATVAAQLQQLFMAAAAPGVPGAAGAFPGAAGGFPGAAGAFPGAVGGLGAVGGILPQLTLTGAPPEGAPLVPLRITVDPRTNSIIVAGSRNDLDVIEVIISRLEDTPIEERQSQVVRLKNAIAADVALALNDFIIQSLQVEAQGFLTAFQFVLKQVVVVPEPITNSLLISATPTYFAQLMNIVAQLDQLPPQVLIQAMIAEVVFDDFNEFGVELGFQSPIMFQRSLLPGGIISAPAFNFNTTAPLPINSPASPSAVALQGLGNLGVGRVNPTAGVGGFIFSAASESVNILVRALRQQGRLDVLSAPKVMTADNQAARVFVGQQFPYIIGSTTVIGLAAVPTIANQINYAPIGVQLQVTPKINPDGSVIMRVIPEVSSVAVTNVLISEGVFASAFNTQTVETTVIAQDGETVVLGGLITRRNEKDENRIPWFGDLPGIGALFRYRQQRKNKTELLIILTPHIVRCRADADRILAEESEKMSWILPDVLRTYGPHGMEPVMPGYVPPPPGYMRPPLVPGSPYAPFSIHPPIGPMVPGAPILPTPAPPAPGVEILPTPTPVPNVPGLPQSPAPQPPMEGKNTAPALLQPVIHDRVPTLQVPRTGSDSAQKPASQPQGLFPKQQPQQVGHSLPTVPQPQAAPMTPATEQQGPFLNPTIPVYPQPVQGQPYPAPSPLSPSTQPTSQGMAPAGEVYPAAVNINSTQQGRESQQWPYAPKSY